MAQLKTLQFARKVSILTAFVAVMGLFSASVWAAVDDIYTVRGVPVDAQADEAAEARIIAIRQGRQMALRLLFQRLTLPIDWALLPVLDSSEVTAMGAGFEVAGERNSPTRYLATMTYRFKPNEVRRVLREFDIPFSESQARTMVVLPVFEGPGQVSIWEEENTWRQAWTERNYTNELVPLISPLGDLSDVLSTPIEAVQGNRFSDLTGYALRYGVRDILIVRLQEHGEFQPLSVEAIRLNASKTEGFTIKLPASDDINSSMQYAIDQIVGRLQRDWKAKTIIRYGDQRPMIVSARFSTVGEWMKIRKAVSETANVVESNLVAMSTNGAQMQWGVVGTAEQLALSLLQHNVIISPGGAMRSSLNSDAPTFRDDGPFPGELPTTRSVRDQMGTVVVDGGDSTSSSSVFFDVAGSGNVEVSANVSPEYWIIRYQPETTFDPFMIEEDDNSFGDEEDPFVEDELEDDLDLSDNDLPTSEY